MKTDRNITSLECDCRCCKINFEVEDWGEELGKTYTFSFTSNYLGGKNSRFKAALKALFGKEIIYSEVCCSEQEAKNFLEEAYKFLV